VNLKNTKWMGLIILLSLLMTGISFGERGYDLDEFDDLELNSLYTQKNVEIEKLRKELDSLQAEIRASKLDADSQRLKDLDTQLTEVRNRRDQLESIENLRKLQQIKEDSLRFVQLAVAERVRKTQDSLKFVNTEKRLERVMESKIKNDIKQRLILYDDNLFLLDDEFDFGNDEIELQKLELNPDDMETAKEYEDFLNAFFDNSTPLGTSSNSWSNDLIQKQPKISRKDNKFDSKPSRKVASSPGKSNKSAPSTATFRPSRGALGFGISTIIGATIPVTMAGFSTGSNFGIRIDTPISFNLAGMEANVGTDIYFSSMTASKGGNNLKLTNIIGNVSIFPFSSIEIRTGLGFTPTSIGDYSITALSIPLDVNYYLPMNISGFKFALNLHAQRTLGYPSKEGAELGDAIDFLYLGLLINTPLKF